MNKLDYMSKYQWLSPVMYNGHKATVVGHLQAGYYMVQYIAEGNIVSNVHESELTPRD